MRPFLSTCETSLHRILYSQSKRHFSLSPTNTSDLVLLEPWSSSIESITKITLNNPKKRNCLSSEMMRSLLTTIQEANAQSNTRVIVIHGNGPILSAGHDLKELLAASQCGDQSTLEEIFRLCSELMNTVRESPVPIVTMCHGWAAAAGLQLAAASDIIISTKNCKFATPGVNIGLFCSTPAVELSRCVGRKIAMEMLLTGEAIDAQRAYDIGLVNHVVDNDDLDALHEKTEEIAMKIVSKSKPVVGLGKKGFHQQIQLDLKEAHDTAGSCMVNNLYLADAKEGISSFIEKRYPQWSHQQ